MALEQNSSIEGQLARCGVDTAATAVDSSWRLRRSMNAPMVTASASASKRTIAQERLGAEAFAGAEASAIDFQPCQVGAHLHGKESAEEQRGDQC